MLLRIYAEIPDEYGGKTLSRVGKTFTNVHNALEAARRASIRYKIAELHDDAMSVHVRLLEVFRDGRPMCGRFIS